MIKMIHSKSIYCCCFLLCCQSLLACTQLPAATAFIVINDTNQDRNLDLGEWMNARHDDNLQLNFELGNPKDFLLMDHNQNGYIEVREIGFKNVQYKQSPCEDKAFNIHFKNTLPTPYR